MSKIIYTATVGSKMHGLSTPQSDEDIRFIYRLSLKELVSPFNNSNAKTTSANGEDTESWELRNFVKHLTSGNPTMYEVIKSPIYEKNNVSELLRMIPYYAFDGRKILLAHIGYAEAQLKRYLRNAQQPFEDNTLRRIPKSIVAAYRVLAQADQLLNTGTFEPAIKNYSQSLHDKLMTIKLMPIEDITLDFIQEHEQGIEKGIHNLKIMFEDLPSSIKDKKPDIDALEFLLMELHK
jgi:predicted nucleotidyltransferase